MKAKTFDRKCDFAEKIADRLDLVKARRIGTDPKRVNVDFPAWMVNSLDRAAHRMGVTRQSHPMQPFARGGFREAASVELQPLLFDCSRR
jgi:hypothetical protein